jgi:hypothetical protein
MKVTRWLIEYTDLHDKVVGQHEDYYLTEELAEEAAPLFLERHKDKGAILWQVRKVGLDL